MTSYDSNPDDSNPDFVNLLIQHRDQLEHAVRLKAAGLIRYESADDLVQGIHMHALDVRDKFDYRDTRAFQAWLMRIAEQHISDRNRYWMAKKRKAERMIALTWIIGGGMAAAGGILLGIDSQVRPEMGWILLLPLFAAVVLGGIGNAYGALIGGLTIGIVQQVSTLWLPASYKPAVAFAILILILLIRPKGIFGGT